jgi:predicted ATPase
VGDVVALLGRDDVQLLTLTGPGGTGKTRMGLQAAAELLDDFPDGVYFVPLAPLTDPALVPSVIADALSIREEGGQPLRERLQEVLAGQQVLLVLDNVEHLVEAAPVIGALLGAAPGLKVLATSRIPLRLQAEQEYPVPPLGLPRRKPAPSPAQLSQYEAVRLFIARAQAVKPNFAVDNANAPAIAEICHRLDGLPLAIELAAARVRMLSPQAMLARLEQRLPMLTGGARDAPERQRTLRNAIAWSYDLLSSEEQALFRCLAVFAGGATFEAIETVANPDGDLDVFGGLERLLEQSLLRQQEDAEGQPRFSMLETIREFGWEQLAATGEDEQVHGQHVACFLTLAETAELSLFGRPEEAAWLDRLEIEHDNLRAALRWTLEQEPEIALRLCGAIWWFWFVRGHLEEGERWLERALDRDGQVPQGVRAKALAGAGTLASRKGHDSLGMARLEEALTLFRRLGDRAWTARVLNNLGNEVQTAGDTERARALFEEALALRRELGDHWGSGIVLGNLGFWAMSQGDLARAAELTEEALAEFRHVGDPRNIAWALNQLADMALRQGDVSRAAALSAEGLTLWSEHRDPAIVAVACDVPARIALVNGPVKQSARLFAAAEELCARIGSAPPSTDVADYTEVLGAVRDRLGGAEFAEAWESGRALTADDAVAEALVAMERIISVPTDA